jgi:hypothetical protein
MKTINFEETGALLAHIANGNASIILVVKIPEKFAFLRHAELPTVECGDKEMVVIQKVLRDNESFSYKLKMSTLHGRTDIRLKGKAFLFAEIDYLANFEILIPVMISNSGSLEANTLAVLGSGGINT